MRRGAWRAAAVCALTGLLVSTAAAATENPYPTAALAYLVKVGDRIVWARDPARRLPPASLTKIMTALVALDAFRPEAVVTVGRAAAKETGSRLGLQAGDRMRVGDLFAATIIRSANDACHALADWRAGSEAKFVRLMNRRAVAMGLRDTRFVNACGHDAAGHYTSARDLAVLTEAAMGYSVYAETAATLEATVRTLDGRREFPIANTNALLGRFPGAIGAKTGYTRKAGSCLAAVAERDGYRALLIMLNAGNRWWDAHEMLDRALAVATERRGA
jgi:serine-type D-Ala-D-Ala carboxypeptidase (penicillin-binding protein 5/6)